MEIKVIQTKAYQVVTPLGNRRCFTKEGAYRALAKRMIKNHWRWQCHCEGTGEWYDNPPIICDIHASEYVYLKKLKLQDRLVRWLKYNYTEGNFTVA